MAKRTTLRSSKGTKLYAKRNKRGQFEDIQTYKRAHGQDIKRKSKAETKTKAKKTKKARKKKEAGDSVRHRRAGRPRRLASDGRDGRPPIKPGSSNPRADGNVMARVKMIPPEKTEPEARKVYD